MALVSRGKIRQLFEGIGKTAKGKIAFENSIRHELGLCDNNGTAYRDVNGNPVIKDAQIKAEAFSFKDLAEGILGGEAASIFFDESRRGDMARVLETRDRIAAANPGDRQALLESTGIGIDPSAFANINTFTSVVGGLVERKVLEGFQNPDYIMDQVFETVPTKSNGQKYMGVTPLGDVAKKRSPNRPHPRAQFEERYVTTAETEEIALAVDVTKEAVHFDLTGQVLEQAAQVGDAIALRKELNCIDLLLGVTNNFVFNGSSANTYQTSRTNGVLNDGSNPFTDWTALNAVKVLASKMQDPKTGLPIVVTPDTIVCTSYKENTFKLALAAFETGWRSGSGATTPQTTSNPLNTSKSNGNPFSSQYKKILTSPYILTRIMATDGLNISTESQAQEYYWCVQSGKAFAWMQNWPLTTQQVTPTNYEMFDKGLVASYFANLRGIAQSLRPWYVIRNKN